MSQIKLRVLDERLKDLPPAYGTPGSAAFDLRACVDADLTIEPNQVILIPSGISIYIKDPGLAGMILPRSGMGHKNGIIMGNTVGLIDSDYQGQVFISCWNRSTVPFTIKALERIAQMVIVPVVQVTFDVVDSFETETVRADGGFNSTGTA
jgi:dUTP pyrophosphatase